MPLENATTISQLDSSWPLGLDSATRGDDHLRLLKAVLKAQFPGASGQGFSKPITIKEDELNGIVAKVDGLTNKYFPVGTVVLRMDNKNPGTIYGGTWQLITGDATVTFGNGAAQTGAIVGSNVVGVPLPAHSHGSSHNLSTGNSGDHNHQIPLRGSDNSGNTAITSSRDDGVGTIIYTRNSGTHNHPIYGGVTINSAGTSNATINVSGARIAINIWRRTA